MQCVYIYIDKILLSYIYIYMQCVYICKQNTTVIYIYIEIIYYCHMYIYIPVTVNITG